MRLLMTAMISAFAIASCTTGDPQESKLIQEDKVVRLEVTSKISEDELQGYADELAKNHNIAVDLTGTEWKEDGTIAQLNLKVDCKDGYQGNVKAYRTALERGPQGFERDYSEGAKTPFRTGAL